MPSPSPPPSPSPVRSLSPAPSASSPVRRASKRPRTADGAGGTGAIPTDNPSRWSRRPSVVWFRGHDLRVEDHPALLAAAQRGGPIAPLFIWDESDYFGRDLGDAKRWWLDASLRALSEDLSRLGVQLNVRAGSSAEELENFLQSIGADAVFWNRCYEPHLLQRDENLRAKLAATGLTAESFKSELLVEPWELSQSNAETSYNTFHAYMRAWMASPPPPLPFPSPTRLHALQDTQSTGVEAVEKLALKCDPVLAAQLKNEWTPGSASAKVQLDRFLYEVFPAFGEGSCRRHFQGTSKLSPHIRFGELSPRRIYHATKVRVSRWNHDVPSVTPVSLAVAAAAKHFAKRLEEEQEVQEKEEENHDDELGNENTVLQQDLYSERKCEMGDSQRRESADALLPHASVPASQYARGVRETNAIPAEANKSQRLRPDNVDGAPCDDSASLSATLDKTNAHDEDAPESNSNECANEGDNEESRHEEDDGAHSGRQRASLERSSFGSHMQEGNSVRQESTRKGFVSFEALSEERQKMSDGDSSMRGTGTRRTEKHTRAQARALDIMPHISLSARAFLKNLCLRDFSYHLLFHHPDFDSRPLVAEFASFPWAVDKGNFELWRTAKTGYPIVDAAMRELRSTGWLHNAMRFLLVCFLTKYLLLPWQHGLREFYRLLLDGDVASNALGWQWASGSNADSFPFSCLVNPIKVANRQDPAGEYVRKWVPELRNMPDKYIHQPWKAPKQILRIAGLTLGKDYPNRVVDSAQARRRACDAMLVMKRVFASMRPSRPISALSVHKLLRDWPEDSDMDDIDFPSSFRGKVGLLPSLWSLLHCDDPPVVDHAPGSGPDSILGLEAASLAEGALVVPTREHQESIEHALVTAHNKSSCDEFMASEGLCTRQQRPCKEENGIRKLSARKKQNRKRRQFTERLGDIYVSRNQSPGIDRDDSAVLGRQPPRTSSTMLLPNGLAACNMQGMSTSVSAPVPQTPENTRLRSSAFAQPAQFSQIPPAQTAIGLSHAGNALSQGVQQDQNPLPGLPQRHRQQQNQQQSHQTRQQQPENGHMNFDNLHTAGIQVNGAAGVPMTNFPVMMGPAAGGLETAVFSSVSPLDMGRAVYAQQMGMSSFYGYPATVMPVMQGHPAQSINQGNYDHSANPLPSNAPSSATNPVTARHMAFPGSMPPNYGVFANGLFDPNIMPSSFPASEMGQYTAMHMSDQVQATVPISEVPCHFPVPSQTRSMQNQPNTATVYGIGHADGNVLRDAMGSDMTADGLRISNSGVPPPHSNVKLPAKVDEPHRNSNTVENGGPGSVIWQPISQCDRMNPPRDSSLSGLNEQSTGRKSCTTLQPASSAVLGGGRSTAKSSSRRTSSHRSNSVSGPGKRAAAVKKGTGTVKIKKTAISRRKARKDSATRNSRGSAVSGLLTEANMASKTDTTSIASTLKERENILASVAEKTDHEYYHFARFLVGIYEFTGNTDRHTSKDYVRLCNLKDAYHKQCQSEKEKLKIYCIKTFFSKILGLEVTGEWDRHNHGGVRGPYVYGIREKNKNAKGTESLGKDEARGSNSGSAKA